MKSLLLAMALVLAFAAGGMSSTLMPDAAAYPYSGVAGAVPCPQGFVFLVVADTDKTLVRGRPAAVFLLLDDGSKKSKQAFIAATFADDPEDDKAYIDWDRDGIADVAGGWDEVLGPYEDSHDCELAEKVK